MPKQLPTHINPAQVLSDTIFQVCLGLLLGNASLQKNTSKSVLKYRIKFLQGCLQKHGNYCKHLHYLFKDFVIAPPYYNPQRKTLAFNTVFHQAFNPLASIFFGEKGRKEITSYFKTHTLSAISLAYWFMDDGGLLSYNKDYPRRAMVFNCQAFSKEECEILSANCNKGYDLRSWVKLSKGYYSIVVPAERADSLRQIISPYMVDSMKHKLLVIKSEKTRFKLPAFLTEQVTVVSCGLKQFLTE